MKRRVLIATALAFAGLAALAMPVRSGQDTRPSETVRFRTLSVVLSSDSSVAAYQLELVARGDVTLVGVEGGVAPFDAPPYYDLEALGNDRIVVAALSATDALPPGVHRVVTFHVREASPAADYVVDLQATGGPDGKRVEATAAVVEASH